MHDIDGYETLAVLGTGQFGNVVLVRRKSDRKLFAAKIPHGEDNAARQAARQEAQLLMTLQHVNIIQFVELVDKDSQLALVMEYASGGDLEAFLRWQQESVGRLSESAIMRIFIQIVLALQYLHEHRVMHRDLKPKNILLDGDGIVKLTDFGVSKLLTSSLDFAQTMTGTPHYMAPELLEGGAYDYKSDVWSLGCVLYELAVFTPPFNGTALGAVVGKILHGEPLPISEQYSSQLRALVSNLLEKDSSRRPSLSDILKSDVVQRHMLQLVSVATSHQPMLLDQFAARINLHEVIKPLESVSPFPNYPSIHTVDHNGDGNHDQVQHMPVAKPPRLIQPETDFARQLFFENQLASTSRGFEDAEHSRSFQSDERVKRMCASTNAWFTEISCPLLVLSVMTKAKHKKIIAIGKNYEAHAREMGATSAPKDPVLFLKPTTSYVRNGGSVLLPPGIGEVHHEVELGVVIGKGGKDIAESASMDHVAGYALAIDMTARDLQAKAKKAGFPWTHAKGLDTFTPISDFIPKSVVPSPHDLNLWLKVDDELRQNGNTGDMVHNIPFLISYVSRIMTLEEGDLLITGTPEGVGPAPVGSVLTAGITGLIDVRFPVETRVYKA
ncbi:NEK protein kinase [Phytophthora nicotianae P1976]|uniref:non-specific serine/threonine protein kinase n=1 Tax=Phytophthora nicotianae P1976 TaxID=1317066 RepID=A0A081B2X4_PHYNI|nr:NEK protein kinase [Phytophthora nicotianae P1976]